LSKIGFSDDETKGFGAGGTNRSREGVSWQSNTYQKFRTAKKHLQYYDPDLTFQRLDAEGLVNIPQQIKGLRLSISLREDTEKPNLVWVSLRSVDDFPCNLVAEQFFNGGGHLNASGGRLQCSIDEAVEIANQAIIAFADKLK
jgi:nanoRNase/pAp phosphatase (c-di-AMP/oligoRNAs hydrolase)